MDNKRWYKRISTCFWFLLASLPLIVTLIHFIGYHFAFNSGIATSGDLIDYQGANGGNFIILLGLYCDKFSTYCFPFIRTMYVNLFQDLGIPFGPPLSLVGTLFGWFTGVYFIELLVDFMVWLPRWFHSILEKGFDKL